MAEKSNAPNNMKIMKKIDAWFCAGVKKLTAN